MENDKANQPQPALTLNERIGESLATVNLESIQHTAYAIVRGVAGLAYRLTLGVAQAALQGIADAKEDISQKHQSPSE